MLRPMLRPLRTWSGALLVCALMFCLAGLARPAMSMPSSMPAMEMAASPATGGHAPGVVQAEAAGQAAAIPMAAGSVEHDTRCPMVEKQCAAPKATLVHHVQPGTAQTDVPTVPACSHTAVMAHPNAPPPAPSPPDLHRLCVSRT
ncbi:hypothetical protein J7E96_19740 [Streptomyces sp. ISL-96]|uniref:hypothetical protein n=1 Tax=Streptomyces sp. ISL-96 TaxID=2819191 RepID=UPI001BEBF842|nr:hypothetical protein [Streptomyces sp. ISL-96]MBT2490707.1 hypothetical protein [Streptomyces sp. ISL-96]